MSRPPPELMEYLFRYDAAIQSLTLGLRTVVLEEMVPCHEYIFAMRSKIVLLYGMTERVIADGVCSIAVFRRHVTLGFTRGAELPDPQRLLQGTGKIMRHLRLGQLSDIGRPEVRAYLRRARRHTGVRRPRARSIDDVVTRVKKKRQEVQWWPNG